METLAALILSKFVIVATLSLAAGAVASGTAGTGDHGAGFSAVLAGGALLVIATFVPFAILRMIPAFEAGAVGHLDGLRQRGTGVMTRGARTAAQHALGEGLQSLASARLLAAADGPSSKQPSEEEDLAEARAKGNRDNGWAVPTRDGMAIGEEESPRIIEEVLSGRRAAPPPRPKGPKPIIGWKPEDEGGEHDTQSIDAGNNDAGRRTRRPCPRPGRPRWPTPESPGHSGPRTPGCGRACRRVVPSSDGPCPGRCATTWTTTGTVRNSGGSRRPGHRGRNRRRRSEPGARSALSVRPT